MSPKPPAKSGDNSRRTHPGRNGGVLLSGPSNKNAGRPPDEFKALCRELASNAETVKEVREILKDKHHPAYLGALKWAADRGYGLPSQPVDVTTAGKPLRFTLALGPLNGDSDG